MNKTQRMRNIEIMEHYSGVVHKKGNWTEDYPEKNGYYQNRCVKCRDIFMGRKHRLFCKTCATGKKIEGTYYIVSSVVIVVVCLLAAAIW